MFWKSNLEHHFLNSLVFNYVSLFRRKKKAIDFTLQTLLVLPPELSVSSSHVFEPGFYDGRSLAEFSDIPCLPRSSQKSYITYCGVWNIKKYTHFSMSVLGQWQTDFMLTDKECFMNSHKPNLEVYSTSVVQTETNRCFNFAYLFFYFFFNLEASHLIFLVCTRLVHK